jgi:ABC-2 type transport system permease protein
MRNIGLIIGRELASYVRTPSGYFIAAAVLLFHGLCFNLFAINERRLSGEVLQIYFYFGGIVTMGGAILFSMRLLAEDQWDGTDVLLSTSPIRESQVVLGKYFSALIFLSIVTLMSVYVPALVYRVSHTVSIGHIAAGYAGMLLLGATTLAVGLFASCLTRNPFMAPYLSFVFVVFLECCFPLGTIADPPLQEAISYLAPHSTHFSAFQRGLVKLSDIVYYVSAIYVSLLASIKVLESRRWR